MRRKPTFVVPPSLIALLVVCGLTGGLLTGCAAPKKPGPAARAATNTGDAKWEAGLDRAPTPRTMLSLVRLLILQGKTAQAEAGLNRIIRQDPAFRPAYVELADLLMRQRRTRPAIEVLTAGLKVAPDDPILRNDLGIVYLAERKYAQALSAFEQASAAAPEDARYIANRGLALGMLGRYEDSLAAYGRVLSPPEAHHNLALLCRARGDVWRADHELSLADGTAPADGPAQSNAPSSVAIQPPRQGG
jgi:tetratricopeptide (TPR) repeat protein